MLIRKSFLFRALLLAGLCFGIPDMVVPVKACPFCSAPSQTLTEQLCGADAAILVQWIGGDPAEKGKPNSYGTTRYEIVEVMHDSTSMLRKEDRITLDRYRVSKKGDLFVLLATKGQIMLDWGSPLAVTETTYNYLKQAPKPEAPASERLTYFMKFLEFSDEVVSADAYGEFAKVPYKDLVPLADKMPREKLRKWITDPAVSPLRIGLYGMMLGHCGKAEDADFLKEKILSPLKEQAPGVLEYRLGIDGVIAGFLMLTGDEGLKLIEESKLKDKTVAFNETYAAMQAMRFLWSEEKARFTEDRLRQAMRLLLDRKELADLVINDLARWEDWAVVDQLKQLYDAPGYTEPPVRRAIARFLLIADRKRKSLKGEIPKPLETAHDYLAELRREEPQIVKDAEKYLFFN